MSFQTPIWGCTVGSGYRFRKGGPKPKFAFVFLAAQAGFLPRAGAHASKATGRRGALTADPFFQCDAGHT
jgi:hypothetical protein